MNVFSRPCVIRNTIAIGLMMVMHTAVSAEILVTPPDPPPPELFVAEGSRVENPSDWPATYKAVSSSGEKCTGTLIGTRVLIIAAHCTGEDESVVFKAHGKTVKGMCTRHPKYDANTATQVFDYALCAFDQSVNGASRVERISASIGFSRKGDEIVLLGLGCVVLGGSDASFGTLYWGAATVESEDVADDPTIITKGDVALCSGDSGGLAYMVSAETNTRVGIGVNSKGDRSTKSHLASLSSEAFVGWAFGWSDERSVSICGLHLDAKGCRPWY